MTDKLPPDNADNDSQTEPALEQEKKSPSIVSSISSNSILLGLFALISTAIIAGTHLGTADNIAEQKRLAQLKALYQIVPRDQHDNDLLKDKITLKVDVLGHRKTKAIFLAKLQDKATTLIYPATARDGYSGDIDFIVGINISDGSIAGVRVLSHKETPGLGDKVDSRKSDWILDFNNRRLGDPDSDGWAVKKDGGVFDAFTGATITPRALIRAIATTLSYHHQNVDRLLKEFEQHELSAPEPAAP